MKKLIFTCLSIFIGSGAYAQADAILGTWLTEKKDSKVKVYKKDNKYYGKIIWLKDDLNDDGSTPKRDVNNPNADLRSRKLNGMNIMTGLEWDADDKEWNEGEIYDPRGGSTYSMFARLEDENTLYLKGYIGISLIGRSTTWTRVK